VSGTELVYLPREIAFLKKLEKWRRCDWRKFHLALLYKYYEKNFKNLDDKISWFRANEQEFQAEKTLLCYIVKKKKRE